MEKKKTINQLTDLGKRIVKEVENKEIPKIDIPSRNISNIVLDSKYMCYVIGDKIITRAANNVRHVKKMAQLLKVAASSKSLLKENRHVTKREVYYISESWGEKLKFDEQRDSDNVIEDIEAILERPKEDINIMPDNRGSIYGDLTITFKTPKGRKKTVNCRDTPDGQAIGPRISESEIKKCGADKVIVIETGGMYNRLMEEGGDKKFNALLVHSAGQAPRAVRRMVKRLNDELNLPVYIFTDGDPWGLHIAMVIMSGSAKSAHVNKRLATPKAQWLGVTASDIKEHKLRTDKFKDVDLKRIKELLKDPRYKGDKRLVNELKLWKKLGKKTEQQALQRYGLDYVVNKYLPKKFEELGTSK